MEPDIFCGKPVKYLVSHTMHSRSIPILQHFTWEIRAKNDLLLFPILQVTINRGRRRIYAPLPQPFVYYRFYPAQAAVHSLTSRAIMASRGTLPSDPDFLLDFMEDLPEESDSDEEFDRYVPRA